MDSVLLVSYVDGPADAAGVELNKVLQWFRACAYPGYCLLLLSGRNLNRDAGALRACAQEKQNHTDKCKDVVHKRRKLSI